ncbi:MAG: hypothetical protein PHU21_08300, partial [Elusimicrobia bacterium]|nr:hypothetical protein [Elusimicrobiota bacterium]
ARPGRAARAGSGLHAPAARGLKPGRGAQARLLVEAARRGKAFKPPRWRPVLLSQALGLGAIRPPKFQGRAPDLSGLARAAPRTGPDGRPLSGAPARAEAVEAARPPSQAAACRRPVRHWHAQPAALFHYGRAWGLQRDRGWLWLKSSGRNWWAWTAPGQPTWLWHAQRWWWRSDGVWFMLHEGEVWGYRLFGERRREGLVHPASGTRLEYSADGARVAMITPGDGAWLFDARSGAVLGRWTEDQMPARPGPRAPRSLSWTH